MNLLSGSDLPLLPVQLVLTSLLTDIPCITIATDNVGTEELERPSKFNVHSLMFISMFLGSITALFEIIYYVIIRNQPTGIEQTGMYLFLTLSALVIIFSVRNKGHFWHAPKLSNAMIASFAIVAAISIGIIYLTITKSLFSFTALSVGIMSITIVLTAVHISFLDTIKTWFYKSKIGSNF
ncbi:MAG TPA: cation transporting ATPase C-terminal domain-containing protein [Candidatus Saccharimonadales bacterium]|jgi:Mg2+-importing ATPase|nr:cation transporting ATPase C-terminal domain-containing protein [Candidatus Saccharimonadales bacterium]